MTNQHAATLTPLKKLLFLTTFGCIVGLIVFIIHISNFFSYLSDDPKTCMNCHIMGSEFATWQHSSHRESASCNDCHVPHDNIFKKYSFKAMDGLRHATIFTLRAEPSAIIIKEAGRHAVQENCERCHSHLFSELEATLYHSSFAEGSGRYCWSCHQLTPHGKERSLSSTPFARVPVNGSMIPDWLSETMKKEESKK